MKLSGLIDKVLLYGSAVTGGVTEAVRQQPDFPAADENGVSAFIRIGVAAAISAGVGALVKEGVVWLKNIIQKTTEKK